MCSWIRPLSAAALLIPVAVVSAGAQTRSNWSVQGSALYAGLGGEAYSGIDAGAGFEVQARRKLSPVWSLGCGFQGTYHSLSAFSGDLKLQGAFCEPRRLVDINSESVFPYVAARGAVLRQSLSSGDFKSSADGATMNLGAGIMMPFGNTAGSFPTLLELGASAGYTWFGDFSATSGTGEGSVTGSTGGGWNFVLRVGIAVGLP
jgi:hypothetical protein